jgi:hypothetical protein
MISFSDYIQQCAAAPAELPLVHTTEYFHLPAIRVSHTLQTSPCKVFKEPLLYFFYGRPAYRNPSQTIPMRDVGFYPICFILRPGFVRKVKRLYPFDSGASRKGLYEPAIQRADALSRYEIPAIIENARRLINCFFETDEQYLSNRPKSGLHFGEDEEPADAYYRLINGGGHRNCDDRCSAVEVQIAECLDLREAIIAVVLPNCFMEDDALAETLLDTWKALPLPYDADVGMRPIELHGTIRHLIRQFYRQSRLI